MLSKKRWAPTYSQGKLEDGRVDVVPLSDGMAESIAQEKRRNSECIMNLHGDAVIVWCLRLTYQRVEAINGVRFEDECAISISKTRSSSIYTWSFFLASPLPGPP